MSRVFLDWAATKNKVPKCLNHCQNNQNNFAKPKWTNKTSKSFDVEPAFLKQGDANPTLHLGHIEDR